MKRPSMEGYDDELSIAMLIRSRLIDYNRREERHRGNLSLDAPTGEDDETLAATLADESDPHEEGRFRKAANFRYEVGRTVTDPDSYPGIFNRAKFAVSEAHKQRLIQSLKTLATGEDLETAVNVDEVLRYFAVQVFVMNWDSYLGPTGHNYFLYEEDGILSMLPWDYNLAFGTYALRMTNPIKDPNILINYPINTPAEGEVMLKRPLYHNLMQQEEYFNLYHSYLNELLTDYVESGRFEKMLRETEDKIDASAVRLTDLGDFEDLEEAKARQNEALQQVR